MYLFWFPDARKSHLTETCFLYILGANPFLLIEFMPSVFEGLGNVITKWVRHLLKSLVSYGFLCAFSQTFAPSSAKSSLLAKVLYAVLQQTHTRQNSLEKRIILYCVQVLLLQTPPPFSPPPTIFGRLHVRNLVRIWTVLPPSQLENPICPTARHYMAWLL